MNRKDNKVTSNVKEEVKSKESVDVFKGKSKTKTSSKSCHVKCFRCQGFGHYASQCLYKRATIVLENGDIASVSSSEDEIPPLEDYLDVEVKEPMCGELLVNRKVPGI